MSSRTMEYEGTPLRASRILSMGVGVLPHPNKRRTAGIKLKAKKCRLFIKRFLYRHEPRQTIESTAGNVILDF
jgi:hypothetical protein